MLGSQEWKKPQHHKHLAGALGPAGPTGSMQTLLSPSRCSRGRTGLHEWGTSQACSPSGMEQGKPTQGEVSFFQTLRWLGSSLPVAPGRD